MITKSMYRVADLRKILTAVLYPTHQGSFIDPEIILSRKIKAAILPNLDTKTFKVLITFFPTS